MTKSIKELFISSTGKNEFKLLEVIRLNIPVIGTPVGSHNFLELLTLQEGQIYRALVQQLEGTNAVINLNGLKITVQTEIALKPGQIVWLKVNQVHAGRVLLESVKPPQDNLQDLTIPGKEIAAKNIILQEGQVFQGEVRSVEGNKVLLNTGGLALIMHGKVEAKPGQTLWLEVKKVGPEQIILREMGPQPAANVPNPALAAAVAKGLGLKPTPENLKIVEVLRSFALPLKAETVNELYQELVKQPPAKAEAYLQVRVWAKAAKIPETPANIKALTEFFFGQAEADKIVEALRLINQAQTPLLNPALTCCWWQDGMQHGEVYLWQDGTAAAQNTAFSSGTVLLHFYTRNFGQVWIRLALYRGNLQLAVKAETEEFNDFFQDNCQTLLASLEVSGYKISQLSYSVGRVETFMQLVSPRNATSYSSVDCLI